MFRAFDPESDRLVAVKVFTTDLAPERVHQVVAELERLLGAALTHRAIAAPIATGIHDNHPYLVQEYVSADSLDIVVRHGPASPDDAVRIAAQMAGALDFAAVDGILHGALHPRDVLLTPDDTRLTGLGIARAFERVDVPAPIRRPYTPPECIGARRWDRRADVFSLAAVMHELLWGRRLSAMGGQAGESLTPIDGADLDALRALFARALAEDPAARFETAMEFAEGLKQAFPKVVLASPKRRTPRAIAAVRPGLVERPEVEPRLPLDEPEAEEEPQPEEVVAAEPDPFDPVVLDPEPAAIELSRMSPTPVEVVLQQMDDLPIRPAEPDEDFVRLKPDPAEGPVAGEKIEKEKIVSVFSRTFDEEPAAAAVPAGLLDAMPEPLRTAPESRRSEIWPLALALIVGAAIGFGGGYFFANFERVAEPPAVTAAEPPAPEGREFTENTVADAPKPPATEPASVAPAAPSGPPAAASAKVGRLLVRSSPAGARVFVNGREAGTTPLTVSDLEPGVHRVRVVREGYGTTERRITISTGRPSQAITVPLQRARAAQAPAPPAVIERSSTSAGRESSGGITVISRPAGARVFVDDKLVGTTPVQVPGIAAGSHRVRLELAGYRPWVSSVDVAAGEQKRVSGSLDR